MMPCPKFKEKALDSHETAKFANVLSLRSFQLYIAYITVSVSDQHAAVEVGLVPLNCSVSENETFQICAQLTAGQLGCNITVLLEVTTEGNSTICKMIAS